ncbi:hypothetical protein SLAV_39040 [Streptomyces lavendulae subsp. lavendulae]|uniref:Uncharacterized protein n=1 Tax=Streptomyces lavendulae subsp. lavendulae TaxID=58340 RepID=A0A2K8PS55_STRLA|nr:hypothetical protein SLAV_00350 [Streptomyces lavendulae subsp. lavendulae]ATZ29571.1 hypothetical protein SLAV_39040 [Streptomyces lavendulae subsp. lavendulae]
MGRSPTGYPANRNPRPTVPRALRAAVAQAEVVAGLEVASHLQAGPVWDAFLAVRREELMPQAYVRRSGPEETPPRWDLLGWSAPAHQEKLLGLLYSREGSVPVQHRGELVPAVHRGRDRAGRCLPYPARLACPSRSSNAWACCQAFQWPGTPPHA